MNKTSRLRCLVVDDHDLFQLLVVTTLEREGLAVDTAGNGLDALAMAANSSYDVVVLDLLLPDLNGLEVLERLRAQGNESSILMVSGAATIAAAVSATKLGADNFVEKPLSMERLVALIRQAVEKRGARRTAPPQLPGESSVRIECVPHASQRLAHSLLAVVTAPVDTPSVRAWAAALGVSEQVLYARCAAVGVRAKTVLDLARLLRLVRAHPDEREYLAELFDTRDPRTIRNLCARHGLSIEMLPRTTVDDLLSGKDDSATVSLFRELQRLLS